MKSGLVGKTCNVGKYATAAAFLLLLVGCLPIIQRSPSERYWSRFLTDQPQATRSVHRLLARHGTHALELHIPQLRRASDSVFSLVKSIPVHDLSSLGDPPKPPKQVRFPKSPGYPRDMSVLSEEDRRKLAEETERYERSTQRMVDDYEQALEQYRAATREYSERKKRYVNQTNDRSEEIIRRAGDQVKQFRVVARDMDICRQVVEASFRDSSDRYRGRILVSADSVIRRAVQDSALAAAMRSARLFEQVRAKVLAVEVGYLRSGDSVRTSSILMRHVMSRYRMLSDSLRVSAIRRYEYVYRARRLVFGRDRHDPAVKRALNRIFALDPALSR
jgi:hypothetical protein